MTPSKPEPRAAGGGTVRAHTSEVLHTPLVPNYIRTVEGQAIPIAALDDDTLTAIGRNWTALLLRKAANRRDAR